MVISSSPLESSVQIFSFSKNTSTPLSFNFLTVVRESTVLRVNRETLLVTIKSIFPERASAIMWLNPSRCFVEVSEIPSSV